MNKYDLVDQQRYRNALSRARSESHNYNNRIRQECENYNNSRQNKLFIKIPIYKSAHDLIDKYL